MRSSFTTNLVGFRVGSDVINGFTNTLDFICDLVWDFNVKFFFDCNQQFNSVQGVQAQILGELGSCCHVGRGGSFVKGLDHVNNPGCDFFLAQRRRIESNWGRHKSRSDWSKSCSSRRSSQNIWNGAENRSQHLSYRG